MVTLGFSLVLSTLALALQGPTQTAEPAVALTAETPAEHSFLALELGVYSASNPARGLHARIASDGLVLTAQDHPIAGAPTESTLRLRTRRVGRSERLSAPGEPLLAVQGKRLELRSETFVEWYVNDARGIEQGWTLAEPPSGDESSPLRIEIEVGGLRARIASDALSARFVDAIGTTRVHYGALAAWDAHGNDLRARMLATAAGLAIEVHANGAHYPVTIDPLMTGAVWSVEGNEFEANCGRGVSDAGDVNGDGFGDVMVGAPYFGSQAQGRVQVFHGSPSGLSVTHAWAFQGGEQFATFGTSVSRAGDVNGDGYDDVIVGAPAAPQPRVHIFTGSAQGLSLAGLALSVPGNQAVSQFGCSVSSAGDVNGDGFDDVIVGAKYFTNGQNQEGAAFVYLGSAAGVVPTPAWSAESDQPTAELGFRVSGAGDVNGDSFDDVIVGAWRFDGGEEDEGRVLVYLGSASGLAATPAWTAESNQVLGQLGSVSTAGDVNADGFDDVLVGASDFGFNNHNDGRAFLYLGSAGGLGATPAWTAENGAVGTRFAFALSAAGDVNADGFGDVVVAAPNFFGAGKVYLYLGVPAGLVAEPSWSVQAPVANKDGGFGFSLSGAGDVNGDGRSDVIVGDPHYETPGSGHDLEGRALVYCGDPQRVTAFCFGDGQGTACPCGNSGASGHGCASSFDPTGALLQATGTASVGADSIVLHGSGLSNSVVSFFQGTQRVNGGAGAVFGDGLRCAGGTTVRLAAVLASANTAQYPNVGDQPVSVRGAIPPAGATRTYQIWYRNAASFCTSATYNLTNGVELVWVP